MGLIDRAKKQDAGQNNTVKTDPVKKPSLQERARFNDFKEATLRSQGLTATGGITPVGNTGIGKSQFDYAIPEYEIDNLDIIRATRQPGIHQATNALIGGIGSGLMTAVEDISYILDVPNNINIGKGIVNQFLEKNFDVVDYFKNVETIDSNFVADFVKNNKEAIIEALPIYRKRPNQTFDWNDSGFYWEMTRGMLDSAVGFGAVGMGAGALAKGIIGNSIRGLARAGRVNRLKAYTDMVGKSFQTGQAGNVTAAAITNFGEGKMMGLELYEQSYEKNLTDLVSTFESKNGRQPNEEELISLQKQSSKISGDEANSFILRNSLFMLTDYLQLKSIFKGAKTSTRDLMPKPGMRQFWKSQLGNAPKEALEEVGQNVLQMEGKFQTEEALRELGVEVTDPISETPDWGTRFTEFATSDQALLEGIMGLFSGPIQYAITTAPFQNKAAELKRYSDQQSVIQKNKEFFQSKLKTTAARSKTVQEAIDGGEEKVANAFELQEFDSLVLENLTNGTTENLQSTIESELQSDEYTAEEKEQIQEKLNRLLSMEQDYQKYQKYANASGLYQNRVLKRQAEDFLKVFNERQAELLTQVEQDYSSLIEAYNKTSDDKISFADIVQAIESNDFNNIPKAIAESLVKNEEAIKVFQFGKAIKDTEPKLFELQNSYNDYKESRYNLAYEIFQGIMSNQNINTEEKIEQLNNLEQRTKKLKNKTLQNQLKTNRNKLEQLLNQSKERTSKTDTPEQKAAQVKKENVKNKKKKVIPTADEIFESNLSEQQKADLDFIRGGLAIIEHEEGIPSEAKTYNKLSYKQLSELDPTLADQYREANEIYRNLSNEEKGELVDTFKVNEDETLTPAEIFEDKAEEISESQNKNTPDENIEVISYNNVTTETNTNIRETEGKAENTNSNVDVKVSNYASPQFKKWIENGISKEGETVVYRIDFANSTIEGKKALGFYRKYKDNPDSLSSEDKQFMIDYLPIRMYKEGDSDIWAYLYTVRPGENTMNAAESERALRKQVIESIKTGQTPTNTIQGQYGGNLRIAEEDISILSIPDFLNSKPSDIPIWYVDKDGYLKDSKTRQRITNPKFNKLKVKLKANGKPMTGALFTSVKKVNGELFPLKLNIRNLNEREVRIVTNLLYDLIKPPTGNINTLDRKVKDVNEDILKLLSEEDRAFVSDNVTYKDLLNLIVYEGERTKSNTATQLYISSGKIHFGDTVLDLSNIHENGEKLKEFLRTYKTRSVDLRRLEKDNNYRDYIMSTGVITTNADVNGSTLFSTLDTKEIKALYPDTMKGGKKEAMQQREQNRYKTGSIYVKNNIDNPVAAPERTTQEQPQEDIQKEINKIKNKYKPTQEYINETLPNLITPLKRGTEKKEIVLNTNDGEKIIEIDAIDLGNIEGFNFFMYKDGNGNYSVIEESTGRMAYNSSRTGTRNQKLIKQEFIEFIKTIKDFKSVIQNAKSLLKQRDKELAALDKLQREIKPLETKEKTPTLAEKRTIKPVPAVNKEANKNEEKMNNTVIPKKPGRRGAAGLNLDAIQKNNEQTSNKNEKNIEDVKKKNNKNCK